MTNKEAGKYLVQLYADYEHYAREKYMSVSQKYSEAIAMAIMALESKGE